MRWRNSTEMLLHKASETGLTSTEKAVLMVKLLSKAPKICSHFCITTTDFWQKIAGASLILKSDKLFWIFLEETKSKGRGKSDWFLSVHPTATRRPSDSLWYKNDICLPSHRWILPCQNDFSDYVPENEFKSLRSHWKLPIPPDSGKRWRQS